MKLCSTSYKKYEISDNEWYEYVPSAWNEKRVKNIFKLITDIAPNDNDFELLSLYASIGVRPRKDMEQRGNKAVTTDGYWIVKKGDIIVNKLLAWMGAIGLSEYDGVTSPAYDVLRELNKEVNAKFYTYLFRTEKSQAIFKKHSRGIMDVRLRLYFDKFGAITVPFPPISEQKTIAHYLDTKTAQIDRKIDLLTQKATLYSNLKQSLINETVTRGLDKTVPMKDSGIEWLGEVSEHWQVKRLKEVIVGSLNYGANETATDSNPQHPRFIRITDFSENEELREETFKSLPPAIAQKYLLREGDILFARSGATVGKTFHFKKYQGKACYAGYLIKARPNSKILTSDFLSYYTKSCLYNTWKFHVLIKATIENISAEKYGFFLFIPLPNLTEQKAITHHLDTKTAQIDQIIQTINTQIERLKELRKTLINDVVTGKIKVVENEY